MTAQGTPPLSERRREIRERISRLNATWNSRMAVLRGSMEPLPGQDLEAESDSLARQRLEEQLAKERARSGALFRQLGESQQRCEVLLRRINELGQKTASEIERLDAAVAGLEKELKAKEEAFVKVTEELEKAKTALAKSKEEHAAETAKLKADNGRAASDLVQARKQAQDAETQLKRKESETAAARAEAAGWKAKAEASAAAAAVPSPVVEEKQAAKGLLQGFLDWGSEPVVSLGSEKDRPFP